MFLNILSIELMKTRRSKLWFLVIFGPIVGVTLALNNFFINYDSFMSDPGDNGWLEAWTQVEIFYSPLIFPILAGVFAALVCRYEHVGGGWKQLLSLAVPRHQVYFAKLLLIALLLACTQLSLLICYIGLGSILGVPNQIPWKTLWGFSIKGWLASLPLASIQLAISTYWRGFGMPLAINIALSLPSILVANTSAGQFYPWAQPMLAMSPADESPIQSMMMFYTLIILVFLLANFVGILSFRKQDVT